MKKAWLVCLALALAAPGLVLAEKPVGVYSGTGRACAGVLRVQGKTLSWMTPFSRCKSVGYELAPLEQDSGGGEKYVFRLGKHASGCRYSVLLLSHATSTDADLDWNVIGYESAQEYDEDKARGFSASSPKALSCYLTRGAR